MCISMFELKSLAKNGNFFDKLEQYFGVPMQKFNDGVEYEVKLNYVSPLSVVDINRKVSDTLEKHGYFSDRCEKQTDYIVNFIKSPIYDRELSVFLYEGKPLMKIKKHVIYEYQDFTIFKSEEDFEYDKQKIAEVVTSSDTCYLGCMRKIRCKDFIVDCSNGMVFASAVTQCITTLGQRKQYQYEIEYYGHFDIAGITMSETKVYDELVKISRILISDFDISFTNSRETKFDFAIGDNDIVSDRTDDFNKLLMILG